MFGICNGQIYKFSQNESLSFEGQKLENHVFSEFTTKNLVTQCAMECFHRKRCASFNFAKESHTCQLNDATHADYPGDFKDYRTEYDYHLRDAFYVNPVSILWYILVYTACTCEVIGERGVIDVFDQFEFNNINVHVEVSLEIFGTS